VASAVVLQVVAATAHAVLHVEHGANPVAEKVRPATQGAAQMVLLVAVHDVLLTVQVAQVVQGAYPVAEKVEPATHAAAHTVLEVMVHRVATTPGVHALHAVQGACPLEE